MQVGWAPPHGGASLPPATASAPLRLRFSLRPAAALFSFWPSASKCGASGGVVAGGGPGFSGSHDEHGSCTTATPAALKTDDAAVPTTAAWQQPHFVISMFVEPQWSEHNYRAIGARPKRLHMFSRT